MDDPLKDELLLCAGWGETSHAALLFLVRLGDEHDDLKGGGEEGDHDSTGIPLAERVTEVRSRVRHAVDAVHDVSRGGGSCASLMIKTLLPGRR